MKQARSIEETFLSRSRAALLRVTVVCLLVIAALGLTFGFGAFSTRGTVVVDGLQNSLSHFLSVGDYFQIQRQLGSLVQSGHFSGVWVYERVYGSLVAKSTTFEGIDDIVKSHRVPSALPISTYSSGAPKSDTNAHRMLRFAYLRPRLAACHILLCNFFT